MRCNLKTGQLAISETQQQRMPSKILPSEVTHHVCIAQEDEDEYEVKAVENGPGVLHANANGYALSNGLSATK
jgi:hypothetical protein